MLTTKLKETIESLPSDQFLRCWDTIEKINTLTSPLSPVEADLVLTYIQARHLESRTALILARKY